VQTGDKADDRGNTTPQDSEAPAMSGTDRYATASKLVCYILDPFFYQ
jgi:hypothetical protein